MGRTAGRRVVGTVAVLGALVAVGTGCSPGTATDPSTPPSPTRSTDAGADLRARLAEALRPSSPRDADLVADPTSTLAVVPAGWLPGWQVVDVQNGRLAHPRRLFVGLSADGTVSRLTGRPEAFAAMVRAAGVHVDDAGTASQVAAVHLDSTRAFTQYSYRLASTADIGWLPNPSADQQQARRRLEQAYADRVTEPRPTRSADGWTLQVWMVDGQTLVDHAVTVTADGTLTDAPRVAERDLPVPVSA